MVTQTEWTVEFYIDARGNKPVIEFINGLPGRDVAKVRNYLRLLREFGIKMGAPHAEPMSGHHPLWELKPKPIRVLYFLHTDHRFIILHAFRKKTSKTPKKDIAIAERRMGEFLERDQ